MLCQIVPMSATLQIAAQVGGRYDLALDDETARHCLYTAWWHMESAGYLQELGPPGCVYKVSLHNARAPAIMCSGVCKWSFMLYSWRSTYKQWSRTSWCTAAAHARPASNQAATLKQACCGGIAVCLGSQAPLLTCSSPCPGSCWLCLMQFGTAGCAESVLAGRADSSAYKLQQ